MNAVNSPRILYTEAITLTQIIGAGMQARYYADGIRISRDHYNHLNERAVRRDCFHTRARPVGTRTRRTNYSVVYL